MGSDRKQPFALAAILLASVVCGLVAVGLVLFSDVGLLSAVLIYIFGSAVLTVILLALLMLRGTLQSSKRKNPACNPNAQFASDAAQQSSFESGSD